MSYVYADQRPGLFSEYGAEVLLRVQRNAERLIAQAGAVRAQESWAGVGGDSWVLLAALDYLVETGALREVTDESWWGQHRVFVAA